MGLLKHEPDDAPLEVIEELVKFFKKYSKKRGKMNINEMIGREKDIIKQINSGNLSNVSELLNISHKFWEYYKS